MCLVAMRRHGGCGERTGHVMAVMFALIVIVVANHLCSDRSHRAKQSPVTEGNKGDISLTIPWHLSCDARHMPNLHTVHGVNAGKHV